jgi:hypothetical protein
MEADDLFGVGPGGPEQPNSLDKDAQRLPGPNRHGPHRQIVDGDPRHPDV